MPRSLAPRASKAASCECPRGLTCLVLSSAPPISTNIPTEERTVPDAGGLYVEISRDYIELVPGRISAAPPTPKGPFIKYCSAAALPFTAEWPGKSRSSRSKIIAELHCSSGLLAWVRKDPFPAPRPIGFRNLFSLAANHGIALLGPVDKSLLALPLSCARASAALAPSVLPPRLTPCRTERQ